jgi:hypothetical protein
MFDNDIIICVMRTIVMRIASLVLMMALEMVMVMPLGLNSLFQHAACLIEEPVLVNKELKEYNVELCQAFLSPHILKLNINYIVTTLRLIKETASFSQPHLGHLIQTPLLWPPHLDRINCVASTSHPH